MVLIRLHYMKSLPGQLKRFVPNFELAVPKPTILERLLRTFLYKTQKEWEYLVFFYLIGKINSLTAPLSL